jgi:hypothetical protein
MRKIGIAVLIVSIGGILSIVHSGCSPKEGPVRSITLRSEYKILDENDVKAMVKSLSIFHKRWNKYRSFPNNFELKVVQDEKVVIDNATGLVWHQSGSKLPLPYTEAVIWLKDLNKKGYGGYYNWRLPTLEEAGSLLEAKRTDKRYIDPLFSFEQNSIYTGDVYNEVRLWGVSFQYGSMFRVGVMDSNYVRPVTKYKEK